MRDPRLVPLLLVSMLFVTAAEGTVTIVEDGDFADADWELVSFSFRSTGAYPGGYVAAGQAPGGNPGTRRYITNNIAAAPSPTENATTWGSHFYKNFSYDPASQGALGSIDYFEDALKISGFPLAGPALRQAGKIYWVGAVPTPVDAPSWTPFALRRLLPADFNEITADGPNYGSHPDFSAAAPPIEVGFTAANSNGPGASAYPVYSAIDNWRIRLNSFCTTAAECDDGDACTVDDCIGGICEGLDTCDVPAPNVKAEVHAVGTITGVTTPTDVVQEKRPPADLTDAAMAQAASSPAGAVGEARSSLAGGLGAKASASLLSPGEFVGAAAIASHTRVFDVTSSSGPLPATFDVQLLLNVDGELTTISDVNSTPATDLAATVVFGAYVADGGGMPLARFERTAWLVAGNVLGFPFGYPTSDWQDSFGPDGDPDPFVITRPMNYLEFVTRTVAVHTPPRIAVEMRLTAEAHTTPALPQRTAISNFYDTATVQVSSLTPGVVLTEVDPAATTTTTSTSTTTTLPPRVSLLIDGITATPKGRVKILTRCVLLDPSALRGASCKLVATSPATEGRKITKSVRRPFDESGSAAITLSLNKRGRKQLVRDGGLVVNVTGRVTERSGAATDLEAVFVLYPPVQ